MNVPLPLTRILADEGFRRAFVPITRNFNGGVSFHPRSREEPAELVLAYPGRQVPPAEGSGDGRGWTVLEVVFRSRPNVRVAGWVRENLLRQRGTRRPALVWRPDPAEAREVGRATIRFSP